MDTVIQAALTAFEKRDLDVSGLVTAALTAVDNNTANRQTVVGELTSAFQAGGLSANDLAFVMKAIADDQTRMAKISLRDDIADTDATVYAAQSGSTTPLPTHNPAIRTQQEPPVGIMTEPMTHVAEPMPLDGGALRTRARTERSF